MPKSEKLYKNSPKVEKDKDGKPGISKPKPQDKDATATGGAPLEGGGDGMPLDIHEQEHTSMYKRHQEELSSMSDRHLKDVKEMHKRHLEFNKQSKLAGTDAASQSLEGNS